MYKNNRKLRGRAKIKRVSNRPRLVVARSNKQIQAQVIDDKTGNTIATVSSLNIKTKSTKTDSSFQVGEEVAKMAIARKVKEIVFDRSGYQYHGRVKALAEGARKGGLVF